MALASILFTELKNNGTKIESVTRELYLDVTISERPVFTNRITTNPIEDGSSINDHVIDVPDTLTLDGFISDSPVKILSGIRDIIDQGFGSTSRSKNAFDLISNLKINKTIISIISGLTIYNNMIISQFTPIRNRTVGKALRFTLTLQKIKTVESKIVSIPASNIRDVHAGTKDQIQSTTDTGKQSTKDPGTEVKRRVSIVYAFGQGAGLLP